MYSLKSDSREALMTLVLSLSLLVEDTEAEAPFKTCRSLSLIGAQFDKGRVNITQS